MWKNIFRSRQTTEDNIIGRMRFTCWITKATDTHSEYVILLVLDWHRVHTKFSNKLFSWFKGSYGRYRAAHLKQWHLERLISSFLVRKAI